jgi:hypothetical protein
MNQETQTGNLYNKIVKNNGLALKYIQQQTPELCMTAVQQNGLAVHYVKEITDDIYLEAVKQNGNAIFSPDELEATNLISVCYKDYTNNTYFPDKIPHIKDFLFTFVKDVGGITNRNQLLKLYSDTLTLNDVKNNNEFQNGLFFIKKNDYTYIIYKKETGYKENGWVFSNKVPEINIHKVRKIMIIR